jgi:phosphohistidine phosphatase SixA
MRLVLIRHAEAVPGSPDELRALTPEGREQARRLGEPETREALAPGATAEDILAFPPAGRHVLQP